MNANSIKFYSKFVISALLGACTGYLIADYIHAHRDDLPEVKDDENKAPTDYAPVDEVTSDGPFVETLPDDPKPYEPTSEMKKDKKNGSATKVVDYTKFSPHAKESVVDAAKKYLPETTIAEALVPQTDKPYVVDADTYAEVTNTCKHVWTYYEEDDTLADEGDDIVKDIDGTVGPDALVSFGVGSGDPDVVFVRNPKNGNDYEICRMKKKYSVVVLGMADPDTKKATRRATTRKVKKLDDDESED